MLPFDQAWALLKQYSQTGLPGMEYQEEFDKRIYDGAYDIQPQPQASHIEYDPTSRMFRLRGDGGEMMSSLYHHTPRPSEGLPNEIEGLDGMTPDYYRRRGNYGKLMQGLLNAGIGVTSDERNHMSQGFHERFQDNLTPNLNVSFHGERPKDANWSIYNYSRKPIATFGDSDLAQRDYGALPIKIKDSIADATFREPYKTRQKKLSTYIPFFREWENEQKRLAQEARHKELQDTLRQLEQFSQILFGRKEEE